MASDYASDCSGDLVCYASDVYTDFLLGYKLDYYAALFFDPTLA